MSNGNGATFKGPWWIAVVERTGSLGLVLIMLVGGYLLAKEYTTNMNNTWKDIEKIISHDSQVNAITRDRTHDLLETIVKSDAANAEFMATLAKTVNERLDSMETRMRDLERKVPVPSKEN